MHMAQIERLKVSVADLRGLDLVHQFAQAHDAGAGTDLLHPEEVMRGHQHGHTVAAQAAQQVGEFVGRLGVQA